jgi:ABC-type nitrate/sulfonate/bicarbonate transport system permease component
MSANRKSSRFNGLYALASLLAFWWILSIIIGQGFLPPPHVAAVEFLNLLREGNLLRHSMASFLRLAGGIAGASLLGLPLGIALGTSRRVDRLLSPLLYILYPLPKIAFLPLFLLLFGLGNASKIVLLFTVMFFQIVLAVRDGLSNLPVEYRRVADSLNIGRRRRFATLYLPAALPGLFAALRISVGIGMAVLFFAENYATDWGLGYLVMNSWTMVNYPRMFAGIIALGLVAAGSILLVDLAQRVLCPWLGET